MADPSAARRASAREQVTAAVVALAVAALYLAVATRAGALGASRNDDWTYYRIAFELADTGDFRPDPYTRAMVLGQIVLAQPLIALFGKSLAAVQVLVALVGAAGLWSSYLVLRSFLPRWWATFSASTLALGPLFGSLSVSFMSDAPSFALQAVALWVGLRALRSEGGRALVWLATSLLVSLVGFTVREYAVGSAIAVLGAFLVVRRGDRPRVRLTAAAMGVGWVAVAAALYYWRTHLPSLGEASPVEIAPLREVAKTGIRIGYTAVALTLPALLLLWWPPRRWSRRAILALGAGAVIALPLGLKWRDGILLGNYLTPRGSYPETLLSFDLQPVTFPTAVWPLFILLVVAGAVSATATVLQFAAPPRRLLTRLEGNPGLTLSLAFAVVTLAVSAATTLVSAGWLVDRYLVACVPFVSGLAVWTVRRRTSHRALGLVSAAVLTLWAVMGLHQVDTAATFDGAKHQMGRLLVERGYRASTIDSGLEWFGMHQKGDVQRPDPDQSAYAMWLRLVGDPTVCVRARFDVGPSSGASPIVERLEARSLLGVRYGLVAEEVDVNCPSPGPAGR